MGTPAAPATAGGVAVVVPIKSFAHAKGRLADTLSEQARSDLARRCAHTVLAAARPLRVFVVCDDTEVAEWARTNGASVVAPPRPGLNEAVAAGRTAVAVAGYARVLVVHSDLPAAQSLALLADEPTDAVIVPDRHHDGTNALLVPTAGAFTFRYGPGSFAAHQAALTQAGWTCTVVNRPDLALDLDTPDDLRAAGITTQK